MAKNAQVWLDDMQYNLQFLAEALHAEISGIECVAIKLQHIQSFDVAPSLAMCNDLLKKFKQIQDICRTFYFETFHYQMLSEEEKEKMPARYRYNISSHLKRLEKAVLPSIETSPSRLALQRVFENAHGLLEYKAAK